MHVRERLDNISKEDEPDLEVGPVERRNVTSLLEGPDGDHPEVNVALAEKDGELAVTNFWDLDMTLLKAEEFHFKAVDQIYPEFAKTPEEAKELHEFYVAGFKLGNSFREWDRMRRICEEGQVQYKDPALYEADFMHDPEKKTRIDAEGNREHELANAILQRYGAIAYSIMEKEYGEDPKTFQEKILLPEVVSLLEQKARLGQAHVFMTANQNDFAKGLVKFSGLYKYGLAIASDENMGGGGKEGAIEYLIKKLAEMNLNVNRERSVAIGDSIKGDVGSGAKAGLGSGILVGKTAAELDAIRARIDPDTKDGHELIEILDKIHVEVIPRDDVKKSDSDVYLYGKKSADKKGY